MQYKRYILLILLLLGFVSLNAQDVSFLIDAPETAEKGSNIQLKYTVKNRKGDDFKLVSATNGFDILYGPAVSHSSSTSVVNGEKITESSITYSYVLQPNKAGVFTLPVASITIDGKKYLSNSSQIKVFSSDKENASVSPVSASEGKKKTASQVSDKDVFLRLITSTKTVSNDRPFEITCRLYAIHQIKDIKNFKHPDFDGFTKEEIELPAVRQLEMQAYNGRNYYVIDLVKYNLYPERHGNITISPFSIDILLSVPAGQKDEFFGTTSVKKEEKKALKTEPVIIKVLPAASLTPRKTNPSTGSSDGAKKKLSTKKKKAAD